MATVSSTARAERKHRIQTLLDTETLRGLNRLVRRQKSTQSTVIYELIQRALRAEAEERPA